ncbi:MAG: anaerobic sulfatase maturase [Dehalococcoidales bacterium]|nr:anaerobic sulfatase maturase [Dehalococcoidales bacterium]
MPPISVLIKPASGKCNLNCKYCFYHDVASNRAVADFGFMSLETIEEIIKKALKFASGYATFSFQGGEPTLCGLDFFKSVVELQNKHNVNNAAFNNCIQTNGMLIDEKWAEFLHDNHFLVGLSLDGFDELHDAYRVDAKGKGTYAKVMETATLFDKHKVEYNILFTVTGLSTQAPEKLYDFFKSKGCNFLQFMPCIDPEDDKRGVHDYSLKPEQYTVFLKQFFDKWCTDFMGGREVSVRYYDNLVRMVMGMQPEMCSLTGSCQCQFVFEADGSVYPCDFYVTDEWKLGNIHRQELMELYESETCQRFINSSLAAASLCCDCESKYLCRGGCRRDRDNFSTKQLERNYFCQSYKDFLKYAYPRLGKVAEYVKDYHQKQKTAGENTATTKG